MFMGGLFLRLLTGVSGMEMAYLSSVSGFFGTRIWVGA
jgi:hypothetical protein